MTQDTASAQQALSPAIRSEGDSPAPPAGRGTSGKRRGGTSLLLPEVGDPGAGSRGAVFGMDLAQLEELMSAHGQKPYRARQLFAALYRQRAASWDDITVLPNDLRKDFAAAGLRLGIPEIVQTARSVDGTERYLVRCADGETVETVWMPDGDGGERGDGSPAADEESSETVSANDAVGAAPRAREDLRNIGAFTAQDLRRATICISSQVGCAVNCQFCLTAKLGIRRNLTAGEIAGQVVAVLSRHGVKIGRDRINLVFMGMGEPFLNYDAFMKAVRLLVEGVGIPESRMTVSTSGIEPAIRRFAAEPIRPKLALSLNASNDAIREAIMPITRKWKIADLLAACGTIPLRKREWVTFEYVLLGGVNDQPEHAREVLSLLDGQRAKVNLIVWNPGPDIAYQQPTPAAVDQFQKILIGAGLPAYIRRPRGRDIFAACGQLKRTTQATVAAVDLVSFA